MKKTYQNPQADYITMSLEELTAASPVENGFDLSDENFPTTEATEGNLSRRSIWDDGFEEDEEF